MHQDQSPFAINQFVIERSEIVAVSIYLTRPIQIQEFQTAGYLKLGVTDSVLSSIRRIFDLTPHFFRRSQHEKIGDAIAELNEGWRDFGGEFSIGPERPDLHESFWVTPRYEKLVRSKYSPLGLTLYREMRSYISMLSNIERTVTKELLEFVTGNTNVEPGFSCERDSDLQALYYQPCLHDRECLQEPHDDSLYMTFLKANRPGLELQSDNGSYVGVELCDDELIVMPGEILALLTGYKIKPQIHRVARHSDQIERLALGYFAYPNIEPNSFLDAWITNETNDGVNIMHRVIRNQAQFLIDASRNVDHAGSHFAGDIDHDQSA